MLGPQVVAQQHAGMGNSVEQNDRCHNRGRPQSTLTPHSKAKSNKKADQFASQYFLCSHAGIWRGKWHQARKYHLQYSLQSTIYRSQMHSVPGLSCCISIQNIISASSEGKGSTPEITVEEILLVLSPWMPCELLRAKSRTQLLVNAHKILHGSSAQICQFDLFSPDKRWIIA